jgi:uncharacterized membrane protein
MTQLFFYPIANSYLLVLAVALALLGLLVLRPRHEGMTWRRRAALLGLRLGVILMIAIAMLRPTIVQTETTMQSATAVIVNDVSRSMSVPDELGGRKSRYEAMRIALGGAEDQLAKLAERFTVEPYVFDATTRPVGLSGGVISLPDKPTGEQTAIGAALSDILRSQAGKRVLGVVLLSDGAQRAYAPRDLAPQTAASEMKRLGVPLYTVTFGQSRGLGQAKDAAVTELLVDQNVFAKNEMVVSGKIRADGFVNRELPVRLLFEKTPGRMEVVASGSVKPTADGQIIPITLSYVPETPGQYKVTLEVPDQAGELVTTNNRMSTFVNVLAGGLNVLFLEDLIGRRPETPYLCRALAASPDIDVDYMAFSGKTRPGDLDERLAAGRYLVYILGDIPASTFTRSELQDLADAVDRGAGLIMLGGYHTFGPGGYADTPLAKVLPIRMSRLDIQKPGEPIRTDMHLKGPTRMRPSRFGARSFIMRLAADPRTNLATWSQLPALDGANKFSESLLAPRALVLAVDQNDRPLLVSQTYGAGRVLAFAGDTTWLWQMKGFGKEHKRFWRQVILWLAKKDEIQEGNVWVRLSQRRLEPEGRLEIVAGAKSPTGEPVEGVTFDAEVALPDGTKRPVRLSRRGTSGVGTFSETRTAGDYTVTVRVRKGTVPLGQARARFLVFEEDLELDNASADRTGMEALAAMTGGRSIAPEQVADLFKEMIENTRHLEEKTEVKRTWWDTWTFFLLLVGLLAVEWFLRKRWGLV